jgi:hypothetical protein
MSEAVPTRLDEQGHHELVHQVGSLTRVGAFVENDLGQLVVGNGNSHLCATKSA